MKFGFIGTGNMASAIIKVMSCKIGGQNLYLSNRTISKAEKVSEKYGCSVSSNINVAKECDYVILGVKPQMMKGVIDEIKGELAKRNDYVLVTMAAGYYIEDYFEMLGFKCPIIRIMPNTPVSVNEGVVIYCHENVSDDKVKTFIDAIEHAGKVMPIDEGHFDAAGTVSGCGPAFADLIIEGLSDGGVLCGLTRKQATELASQMLLGASKLVLESGRNPIELKDEVTSPGGTTIEGVLTMEENRVSYAMSEAVIRAFRKNELLRKK